MSKRFTPEQSAAISRKLNAVVSAGAGSGKTTVLVERYAKMVEEDGLAVDSILALTFTRKAAAEMNTRIYARLTQSDVPAAREQLEQFDKARISTLDSFCSAVARGACHRFGLPPDFSVDEPRLSRIADEAAVELMMDRKLEAPFRRLVASNGFDRIRAELFAELAKECIGIVHPPAFGQDALRQVSKVRAEMERCADAFRAVCDDILAIVEDGGETLSKAQQEIAAFHPLPVLSGRVEIDESTILELLSAVRVIESIRRPGTGKKPGFVMLKELISPLKDLAAELRVLIETYRLREDIIAVGAMLDDFSARFQERKRREGIVSFRDAADLAREILLRDAEIRTHYKSRIRSIMIDEFQDNNKLQKELLFLLAEREDRHSGGIPAPEDLCPDKLFFVGDEKQSIYRFRGADVSVFRTLSEELDRTGAGNTDLALSINHRSSAELVSFFNQIFPGIFGPADNPYEARFSSIGTLRTPEAVPGTPAVEFHLFDPSAAGADTADADDSDAELSAAENVAAAAARRIGEGVKAGEFAFKDVALLFRSTTHQHEYERALRNSGIPFRASDPRGLFAEGPMNDFYSILRLALFPSDRNAYAAVLRSPFVRLGDDSLAKILLDPRREPFIADPNPAWFSTPGEAAKFERGRELYDSVGRDIDQVAVSALIARLWYDEGYRAILLEDEGLRTNLDHFPKLYSLALDADSRRLPLTAFLDELAPLMGSSERIEGDESDAGSADSVALLTVHKSKGLEFPVVIIADAGSVPAGLRNGGTFFVDDEYGTVVNLRREESARDDKPGNWFFNRAKAEEEKHAAAELRRLLYVAATRAEKKLLIFGSRKANAAMEESLEGLEGDERLRALLVHPLVGDKGDRKPPKSFLDLFAEGLSDRAAAAADFSIVPIPPLTEGERRLLRAAHGANRGTATPPGFYASAPAAPRKEAPRAVSPTALERTRTAVRNSAAAIPAPGLDIDPMLAERGLETFFGTLCHLAVDHGLEAGTGAAFEPRIPFPDGVAESERRTLIETAWKLALGFLGSPLGRLAGSAVRRRIEYPFLLGLTPKRPEEKTYMVNGVMDLIFETQESPIRCLIVDFKTDRIMEDSAHSAQLACYRQAAGSFSDARSESWLFYLRSGIAQRVADEVDLYAAAEHALGTGEIE